MPTEPAPTDAEHAAVLRRHMTALYFMKSDERAAIERAIELLDPANPCWCEACGQIHEPSA